MRGLSTTSDQIPNKNSPVAPSAGNPCHDLFYKILLGSVLHGSVLAPPQPPQDPIVLRNVCQVDREVVWTSGDSVPPSRRSRRDYKLRECLKSDLEILKKQNLKREYYGGYFDDSDDDEDDGNCEKISDVANSCRSNHPNSAVPIRTTFLLENIARKEFLEPLDKYNRSTRTHMGFGRMPFNVEKYLEEVKADKSKIAANALLPGPALCETFEFKASG
ncbi:hypothetical protein ACFX11_039023 [Malus domestica]